MAFGFGFGFSRLYGALAAAFSPAALFAAGEQGTWYDPSDLTTLFQDSAGTTPVTAVQQPVGLMLDKSKGLVLGANVWPSTFDAVGANWTNLGGGAYSSNGGAGDLFKLNALQANKTYSYTITVTSYVSGILNAPYDGSGSNIRTIASAGTFTGVFRAIYGTTNLGIYSVSFNGTISSVTVRELPGNHAFQTTSASRPVLSARYNLLTKTEQLADAAWVNGPTSGGSRSAGALTLSSSEGYVYINQTSTLLSLTLEQSISFDVTCDQTILNVPIRASGTTNVSALVNLVAGVTQRVTLTGYRADSGPAISLGLDARNAIIPGGSDATGYVVTFDKIDVRVSNDALGQPAYQRVNTATDYDTVGFKPYLAFDGVDDSLVTNSIDFTGTDKMTVFAGVRKLSDAAASLIFETSVNAGSNNGSFLMSASGAGATYGMLSRGTANANGDVSTYTAPITNVLSGDMAISADRLLFRVNGAQVASYTGDQGTGNYGNYPLFIGRRNQATLPFNGRLYSLIVRGAASTTAQITSTETYVNQKTGAY